MPKIAIDLQKGDVKKDESPVIGIDLGTTFSLVAVVHDNMPVILKKEKQYLLKKHHGYEHRGQVCFYGINVRETK